VNTSNRSADFDVRQFREEVREYCARELPTDLADKARRHVYFSKDDRVRWQRLLQARGWFAAHWPRRHGGADWGPLQRFILIEELELAGTPWLTHFGVSFAGPLIYTYGNEAQQAAYLPGILNSTTWWCQGFSEPGAGSDLAAVRTRASCRDDHYVVSGQKAWTTQAHWSDMIFTLVRTSDAGRPHEGLSMLLIDMRSAGVSVRPIRTIDGCHHVNEVFFEEVRVPVGNRIGQEGDGWNCVKLIVAQERPLVTELGKAKRLMAVLRRMSESSMRRRLAELEVQLATLEALAYAVFERSRDVAPASTEGSMLKIRGSELQQALLDAIVDALGGDALQFEPDVIDGNSSTASPGSELVSRLLFEHLYARATSIYGGSNEIQRHIIAKAILNA
jgi:alkylation response protein AidB-like acyl-CoA dehydrogenase